jgi:hypothetical protein
MSAPLPLPAYDWRSFGRRIVLAAIKGQRDPSIRKEWIMIAREHGHISDEETEDMIVLGGLVEA